MLFGIKEMREFAENHEDERVRILWRRLEETRSKNARWCDEIAKMCNEVKCLREQLKKSNDNSE